MSSPFGAGQVSPRMLIKLNPPSMSAEHEARSAAASPPIDHDRKPALLDNAVHGDLSILTAAASEAGPSRPMSVVSNGSVERERISPIRSGETPTWRAEPMESRGEDMNGVNGNGYLEPKLSPIQTKTNGKSATKPATPNGTFVSGQKTHRKVSCELCHRRKIRCDQARPACGSCSRKGKVCNYYEDADTPSRPTPSTHPSSQRIDTIYANHQSQSSAPSAAPSTASLTEKGKRTQRERIAGGFDTDSDEDKAVEHDVPDLIKPKEPSREEEVDELDSDSDHGEPSKRGNDELAGELLELASGPPKKKSRPSTITPTQLSVPLVPQAAVTLPTPVSAAPARPRPSSKHRPHSHLGPHGVPGLQQMTPIQALLISLPGPDIQHILFNTFFADPYLSEGISLLHPQFMEDLKSLQERRQEGDATTLGCAFAFLATALRILPDETSKLLLASVQTIQPRSLNRLLAPGPAPDYTPLDQRYIDLALLSLQLAENEPPSVMLVMLELVLYRYMMIRRDRVVPAGQHLAGAIKVAQALGMGKEWEGIPQGERELRRRVMWSLYIADRQLSFDTAFPYTILDAHQGIHLPSPISETDLYKIPPEAPSLPAQSTETGPTPATALFIHTHLARRLTGILDSFATVSPSHIPLEAVTQFDEILDHFQDALPPYMRMFPYTDTRFDADHSYLLPHRLRLHHTLLQYRQGVHRCHVMNYLRPDERKAGKREALAANALSSLRTQRSLRMLDPKLAPRFFSAQVVFEAAAQLALILYVDKALSGKMGVEAMSWRGGVAEGIELLDNITDGEGLYARKAVRILRDLVPKLDGPRKTLDDLTNGDHSPRGEIGAEKIRTWLHGFPSILTLEILLRDPIWEDGWQVVLQGM